MSDHHSGPGKNEGGFSLFELLVVTVVIGIMITALGTVVAANQRVLVAQRFQTRADEGVRVGLAIAETAMRTAGANPFNLVYTAVDPNPLGAAQWDNVRVRADFSPGDGDLADLYEDVRLWVANDTMFARWSTAGLAEPVATPVRSLQFNYFGANGAAITTVAGMPAATRVRIIVTAPANQQGTRLLRRTGWVYLRNR